MKLYYLPGACSLAVHIVLEWVGKPYTTQAVSREQLKQPAFLALNPIGSAPALTHEDLTLTQSTAILQYIAELNPEADLLGNTPKERAETRRWLGMINSDIHRQYGFIFGVSNYTETPACQAEVKKGAATRLLMLYGIADKQLEGKDYLTGKRSIADAYLYVTLRWAQRSQLDLGQFANLTRFYHLMDKDVGVQAAIANEA